MTKRAKAINAQEAMKAKPSQAKQGKTQIATRHFGKPLAPYSAALETSAVIKPISTPLTPSNLKPAACQSQQIAYEVAIDVIRVVFVLCERAINENISDANFPELPTEHAEIVD